MIYIYYVYMSCMKNRLLLIPRNFKLYAKKSTAQNTKMPMKLTLGNVHRMYGKDFRVGCQRKQCGP